MDKQIFQYAILLQEKEDEKGNTIEDAQLLVPPTLVLAGDVGEVNIIASRAIPEEQIKNLDRIDLVVRPF